MKTHTSDFIFFLADKYNISVKDNQPCEFSDESFIGFCNEYQVVSKGRDIVLKSYLSTTPNLFRTFLPWRQYIFDTVFQIQWYYDEVVVYDPVIFEIDYFKTDNIEESKQNLLELLRFLYTLKDSINGGFLLFGSYDRLAKVNQEVNNDAFESLLSIAEIREECDKTVQVFRMDNRDSRAKDYYQIRTYYRNKQTIFPVVSDYSKLRTEEGFAVWFDFVKSDYTHLTLDTIKELGIYDRVFDGIKDDYPIEIKEILTYVDIGSSINTPILFNRKLDELVLNNLSVNRNKISSRAIDNYNLILPFVNGIPSERLFDLRQKMPAAFSDFRNTMFEIIYDIEKNNVERDMMEIKIKQKINPILKNLDAEIKNTITNAKIMGIGAPIISGLGSLCLSHFNIDTNNIMSVLFGGAGVVAELPILSNYLQKKNTAEANSLYYLWKAQQ